MEQVPYRIFFALALASLFRAPAADAAHREYFQPDHRLRGIGIGRAELSDEIVTRRTQRMIESQTFAILRDPRAVAGAQRILSPNLQRLFARAAHASGVPASLIAAIAYIESFGDPRAQSPTGPRGIMQIAAGTARGMGLKILYAKRYRTITRIRRVRTRRGNWVSKRVRVRVPYRVLVRDDRMVPARAVPAAAKYLARLAAKFGGLDWAVFAYHCGEGCAAAMRDVTERTDGIGPPYTVAKMFFGGSPAVNRDLYLAVRRQMKRDYSPTYWFRVVRARQLLALYREDPAAFRELAAGFRYRADPERRAPHRLAVWFDSDQSSSGNGIGTEKNEDFVSVFDDPDYYGFHIPTGGAPMRAGDAPNRDRSLVGSSAALGALAYLAFETRQLHEAMDLENETFVPLKVMSLAEPANSATPVLIAKSGGACDEANAHATGQVFDIDYSNLPTGEREALEFALNDLGWEGYLGFIPRDPNCPSLHIGVSPPSRAFFAAVFAEALNRPAMVNPIHHD